MEAAIDAQSTRRWSTGKPAAYAIAAPQESAAAGL